MRVISGTARGKRLNSLEGLETRPTLDRVKEAVFNILQFNIKDKIVLDLFAGSGALGIEALSRGAKKAIFCDKSSKAISIIKQNIEETRLTKKSEILNKDYGEALKKIGKISEKMDIIFLDPPYKSDYIVKALGYIVEYELLAEDGIIIAETDDKNKIKDIEKYKELEVYDMRKYGIATIIFIRKG